MSGPESIDAMINRFAGSRRRWNKQRQEAARRRRYVVLKLWPWVNQRDIAYWLSANGFRASEATVSLDIKFLYPDRQERRMLRAVGREAPRDVGEFDLLALLMEFVFPNGTRPTASDDEASDDY